MACATSTGTTTSLSVSTTWGFCAPFSKKSRPCLFHLSSGDVAFYDFVKSGSSLKITRMSFDGFGCHDCGDLMDVMDRADAQLLRKMVLDDKVLDNQNVDIIMKKYLKANLNKAALWTDALERHGVEF